MSNRRIGRRPARSDAERLFAVLKNLSAGHGTLVHHADVPWASITFSGARHRIEMLYEGADGIDAAEAMMEALPEHEFTIPGKIAAEAEVTAVEQTLLPSPALSVTIEVLLLDDA